MGYRITGLGGFGFSANWEKIPGDKEVAERVIAFLEDRRLLFGDRHYEDQMHCISSAIDIRRYLTEEIGKARPDKDLAKSLRAMRAAARRFVEAGGPNGREFRSLRAAEGGTDPFSLALGDLRTLFGYHLLLIASQYAIEVEFELARILPPRLDTDEDDLSWIPGFEEQPGGPPRQII